MTGTPHTAKRRLPKRMQPETLTEARYWDKVCSQVRRLGLCNKCAAQYAWGVQIGFTYSHPPCSKQCQAIVDASQGRPRPNGWRTMHKVRPWGMPT